MVVISIVTIEEYDALEVVRRLRAMTQLPDADMVGWNAASQWFFPVAADTG